MNGHYNQSIPKTHPIRVPTHDDWMWAAGVYEGDGCCVNNNGHPSVHVSQKNFWLVMKLRRLFGGGIASHQRPRKYDRQYWIWQANGKWARRFLCGIRDRLSPRRRAQIRKVWV